MPPQLFQDQAFDAPTQRIDATEVFALSPAMKRYLDVDIAPQLRSMGAQSGLVDALYSKAQLRLDYETDITRTAAQAFDARSGNCLSLVVMTAALAKHLSLPIQYQALIGNESWSRNAGLNFVNGHVNIAVARRLVDRINGIDPRPCSSSASARGAWGAAGRSGGERVHHRVHVHEQPRRRGSGRAAKWPTPMPMRARP